MADHCEISLWAHPKPDFKLSSLVTILLAKCSHFERDTDVQSVKGPVCYTLEKLLKLLATTDEITLSDTKWAGSGLNLCQL